MSPRARRKYFGLGPRFIVTDSALLEEPTGFSSECAPESELTAEFSRYPVCSVMIASTSLTLFGLRLNVDLQFRQEFVRRHDRGQWLH